ncbi:kinase-like domain-containing protein [Dunaliella salina]|uniref:non-specific serine/threonine protein kinase n=1 Tax=Dunaliella salina TaxID=3046 RepID=A0ABQ7GY76_DUNSA|nr:kinase-like domain-containing protein [Dunaliella salina]|eukprot:KAF5839552.1 kinase-like domain-containing protein [Dunaliella salina]
MDNSLGAYEIRECIGRGSYGDVFLGVNKETGAHVALKVIDLEDVEDDIEDIHKEITMLAGCRCKNITEYHGSLLKPRSTELMIVMELMACSVADLVQHGPLDESFVAYILHEVLVALAYLHSENRIHRDIKAANILLGPTGGVKISDFGVSGQLSGTMGYRRRTFVGTPFWMAPEVIESSEEGYTELADIWSLGITAIEMATGSPPYSDLHPMRVLFLIPKNAPPKLEGNFSPEFKDFVDRCMQKDPSARPPASELLQHPFVAGCGDTVPEGLVEMVHEFSKRRRHITSRRETSQDLPSGTLPGWDFGTKKFGRSTQKMGDTLKAAVVDRYMQGKPNASDATVKSNGISGQHALSKSVLEETTLLSDDLQPLRDMPNQHPHANGGIPEGAAHPPMVVSQPQGPAFGRSRLHSSSYTGEGPQSLDGPSSASQQQLAYANGGGAGYPGAALLRSASGRASQQPPSSSSAAGAGGSRQQQQPSPWQQHQQHQPTQHLGAQEAPKGEGKLPLPVLNASNKGPGSHPHLGSSGVGGGTGTLPANATNPAAGAAAPGLGASRSGRRGEPVSHPVKDSPATSTTSTLGARTPQTSVDGQQSSVSEG